jgi:hypothetical protein
VNIGNHRSDIASTVRCFGGSGKLDRLEICVDGSVEVHGIALVERVYLAARGDLDLVGQVS